MAPATKYGGKIVACHPGSTDTAKSKLTIEWTESTSGVEMPGEQQVGHLVALPVPRRAAPAERQHAEDHAARTATCARSRSVARSGTRPVNQNSSDTVK